MVVWHISNTNGREFVTDGFSLYKNAEGEHCAISLEGIFVSIDRGTIRSTHDKVQVESEFIVRLANPEEIKLYEIGLIDYRFKQMLDTGHAIADNLFERMFPEEIKQLVRESPIYADRLQRHVTSKLSKMIDIWKQDK